MALYQICKQLNKQVIICHPDPAPSFLRWLKDTDKIINYEENRLEVEGYLKGADVVFAMDYNEPSRLGKDMGAIFEEAPGTKIMIDHHLNPSDTMDIVVSRPDVCSTSQLVYKLLEEAGRMELLNAEVGTPIYLGIMTDTGSFRFPSVRPETHRIVADLIEHGVKHYEIHENVYDTNTVDRLRLRGYATSEKLEILEGGKIALITLSLEELKRFNHQKGDTEGLVNVALSVVGMKAAILMTESEEGYIKISFRSKGTDNPVNVMAGNYFQGGGHMNASGGRYDGVMEEAVSLLKSVIHQFIR